MLADLSHCYILKIQRVLKKLEQYLSQFLLQQNKQSLQDRVGKSRTDGNVI